MKRTIVFLLTFCMLAALLYVPAYAVTPQKVVNKVESKEEHTHSSTVYLGEIVTGGSSVMKYIYSEDAQINDSVYNNLLPALGAMDDKDFSELLSDYFSSVPEEPGEGIKACSEPERVEAMDGEWISAKAAAALCYQDCKVLSEQNGDLYDLDDKFRAECDRQEQKRKEEITYPLTSDKRIVSHIDLHSVDSVCYTVENGVLMKYVDTFVTYLSDEMTVIYTSVVLENAGAAVKPGDVDGSGKVDSTDYILIKRHILKVNELTGDAFKAADMDGNGKLDSTDYIAVKRIMLGLA